MSWIMLGAMFGERGDITYGVRVTVGQYNWLTNVEWTILSEYFM